MYDFEYHAPESLYEAITLFTEHGERARLLAGGTELVNEIRFGKSRPERVIDLKHIRDLDFVEITEEGLRLGALYRVRDAERSDPLRQSSFGVLSHAAGTLGPPQVRNKATAADNVCRGFGAPQANFVGEYGVPAVTGIPGIMDVIKDGDIVRVDGTRGMVEIIEPGT